MSFSHALNVKASLCGRSCSFQATDLLVSTSVSRLKKTFANEASVSWAGRGSSGAAAGAQLRGGDCQWGTSAGMGCNSDLGKGCVTGSRVQAVGVGSTAPGESGAERWR